MIDQAVLARLPVFSSLRPEATRLLAARAVECRYAGGRVLFTAGETPRGVMVILEGRVRVVRGRGGRQQLVHEEGVGGTLGEIPVFCGGAYPATALATEPTVCALFSPDDLKGAMKLDPELAFVLLRRLGERTRRLVEQVDRLATQDVRARLARLLVDRQAEAGFREWLSLGPQARLAEELGTVREVVVRALRELRNGGLIESGGRGRYRVRRPAELAILAD